MVQPGGELDLAPEAVAVDLRGQLGRQNLDDHFAVEREVARDEDPAHASPGQLAHDIEAPGEQGDQALLEAVVGHGGFGLGR